MEKSAILFSIVAFIGAGICGVTEQYIFCIFGCIIGVLILYLEKEMEKIEIEIENGRKKEN